MSLQYFWSLFSSHPAQVVNALALFFALAGSWLLLATRLREQRATARLAAGQAAIDEDAWLAGEPGLRLNRFFYRFATACLIGALLLSFSSTGL